VDLKEIGIWTFAGGIETKSSSLQSVHWLIAWLQAEGICTAFVDGCKRKLHQVVVLFAGETAKCSFCVCHFFTCSPLFSCIHIFKGLQWAMRQAVSWLSANAFLYRRSVPIVEVDESRAPSSLIRDCDTRHLGGVRGQPVKGNTRTLKGYIKGNRRFSVIL